MRYRGRAALQRRVSSCEINERFSAWAAVWTHDIKKAHQMVWEGMASAVPPRFHKLLEAMKNLHGHS